MACFCLIKMGDGISIPLDGMLSTDRNGNPRHFDFLGFGPSSRLK